ncbi:MAG: hypothetical protein ACJAZY_002253 [Spirosomataceae bacterium]|jgi:hypothetical protein
MYAWRIVAIDNCGNESASCPVNSYFGLGSTGNVLNYHLTISGNFTI